ncbi:hypothetical protein L7F22_012657 [Adiantum nelumboides]|nr:hypothetical protein [Adiantum nelumboides]
MRLACARTSSLASFPWLPGCAHTLKRAHRFSPHGINSFKSERLQLAELVPCPLSGRRTYAVVGATVTTSEAGRGPASTGPPVLEETIDYNPPRGTRDFAPDDMRLRSWLFQHFREVSRLFAFEEVDFPVLESEALFVRKAGEEITQQLYNFEDKGGRRVSLRPELTPSLARLVLQKGKGLPFPVKWFAIGQCWRYERMTRGRRREHYQWNMDILGISGVEAEAELLTAIITFFKKVGIRSQDVGIRVSNRKVLQSVLGRFGILKESFAAVCVVVDKMEKISREEIEGELSKLGVSKDAADGILSALSLRTLSELEALLGSENEAVRELKQLFALVDGYGFADWLSFDASVVRGLAYYTGTVFEALVKEVLVSHFHDMEYEEDDDEANDTEDKQGTSGHNQGPDDDDNQDDPPSGTGPSTGGAANEPSNPPGPQLEPPSLALEGNKQDDKGASVVMKEARSK